MNGTIMGNGKGLKKPIGNDKGYGPPSPLQEGGSLKIFLGEREREGGV